jgi:type 1 glutamine amidotransferase
MLGAEHLFAPDHAEKAESLLKSGVGLAALHWGTGVGDANNKKLVERYIDCLGGAFGAWSRYVFSPSRIKQLEPKDPICRGWSDFDLNDEWYLNMRLKPEVKPLAGSVQIHGGWLFSRGLSIGLALVVLWTLINVFIVFLYNLLSDVVGGIEVTLSERR